MDSAKDRHILAQEENIIQRDGDSDGEEGEDLLPLGEEKEEVIKMNENVGHVNRDDNSPRNVSNQLEAFRQQWQEELQHRSSSQNHSPRAGTPNDPNDSGAKKSSSQGNIDIESQARAYFLQGMQSEDDGMLMEAIYYYKKALQLVPDIESRIGQVFTRSPRDRVRADSESSVEGSEIEDMLIHFENLNLKENALCSPEYEQRMTHISCLPVELIMYILRWVVSTDMDFRSLEMVSMVSRGFYMCARDETLWKLACDKVWGVNVGSTKKYGGSFRRMMIERPRLLFDGCYISKVTYIRQGEQSLDQFYRPYHLVEYYRYVRFFPDGNVLMLVSAEDPHQSLHKLRNPYSKAEGLLKGRYKILDSKVTCVLKRIKSETVASRYKRHRQANQNDSDMIFTTEFDVVSSGRRHNAQLLWSSYIVKTVYKSTDEELSNNFDLNKRQFPPLIFSRVRSYTATSLLPLE